MNQPQKYNNPFALIDNTPSMWKGLQGTRPNGFLIFDTPANGVRAGFINLVNAYLKRGLDTIEKIFPVYAPLGHGGNIPENYIKFVSNNSGIDRKKKITSVDEIYKIGKAITTNEEGNFWVSQKDFDSGYKAAMQSVNAESLFKITKSMLPVIIILLVLIFTM